MKLSRSEMTHWLVVKGIVNISENRINNHWSLCLWDLLYIGLSHTAHDLDKNEHSASLQMRAE